MSGVLLLMAALLLCGGCATAPAVAPAVQKAAPPVPVPAETRVLGQATVYVSATGERIEVVHDPNSDVVIVKLSEDEIAILPAEIVGTEGRYRDDHLTLWETDGGVLLWLDGKLVFTGRGVE